MGEGDKRTRQQVSQTDAAAEQPSADLGAASPQGKTDGAPDGKAAGKPDGTSITRLAEAPLTSRTSTLDDPLTTSLLAEVARRSRTVEVSPEQIAEAMEIDSDERDPER